MDKIYLKDIEIFANHGVFQEEHENKFSLNWHCMTLTFAFNSLQSQQFLKLPILKPIGAKYNTGNP